MRADLRRCGQRPRQARLSGPAPATFARCCCATKRLVEIRCPADCVHLAAARRASRRRREAPARGRPADADRPEAWAARASGQMQLLLPHPVLLPRGRPPPAPPGRWTPRWPTPPAPWRPRSRRPAAGVDLRASRPRPRAASGWPAELRPRRCRTPARAAAAASSARRREVLRAVDRGRGRCRAAEGPAARGLPRPRSRRVLARGRTDEPRQSRARHHPRLDGSRLVWSAPHACV